MYLLLCLQCKKVKQFGTRKLSEGHYFLNFKNFKDLNFIFTTGWHEFGSWSANYRAVKKKKNLIKYWKSFSQYWFRRLVGFFAEQFQFRQLTMHPHCSVWLSLLWWAGGQATEGSCFLWLQNASAWLSTVDVGRILSIKSGNWGSASSF